MKSDVNSAWKALPIRRRLVLSIFLVIATHAVLYLLLESRNDAHSLIGVPVAVAAVFLSGIALVFYFRRWVTQDSWPARETRSRRLAAVVALFFSLYLLISAYPQPLFPNSISHQGITVYSDREIGREMYRVIERVTAKTASSAVHDSLAHHRVFLTGSHWKFALFAHVHFRAFGIRSPVLGNIFITKSDPAEDLVIARQEGEFNRRTLTGVLAHEVAHALLRRVDGGSGLPSWKEEGYADYLADESTFDYTEGVRLLQEGETHPSPAYRYFKHRMLVQYLLEVEQVSFERFLKGRFDPWQLEAAVVAELQRQERSGGAA